MPASAGAPELDSHPAVSGVALRSVKEPRSRFAALGLDMDSERAYQILLEQPGSTLAEVGTLLSLRIEEVDRIVHVLRDLELVQTSPDGTRLHPVDPQLGLSALAARLDAELALRRQQVEEGRLAITELVSDLSRISQAPAGQVADVSWGAREIGSRVGQLAASATRSVVAMSTATALAVDESVLPSRRVDGVRYRLAFSDNERRDGGRAHWLRSLTDQGAEVRIGPVPTAALIVDGSTVALPICDSAAGQVVGLATLRLPSAVAAVEELFERVWTEAVPLNGSANDDILKLSRRERDLLNLLLNGATDESAASHLGVSVRTVRRTVSDIMARLEARSRFEAGARAVARGWLALADDSTGR